MRITKAMVEAGAKSLADWCWHEYSKDRKLYRDEARACISAAIRAAKKERGGRGRA